MLGSVCTIFCEVAGGGGMGGTVRRRGREGGTTYYRCHYWVREGTEGPDSQFLLCKRVIVIRP